MSIRSAVAIAGLALASGSVYAGFQAVPEPGVLELVAISAVAAFAVVLRKRRK